MLRDLSSSMDRADERDLFVVTSGPTAVERSTNNQLDDIFGSPPDSPTDGHEQSTTREQPQLPSREHSDVPRLRSVHVTNGYREGIAISKERHIQSGFDEGYSLGAEIGLRAGWCLGAIRGLRDGMSSSSDMDLVDFLARAENELRLEKLFAPMYFGPDGIWLYEIVAATLSEEELTFDLVAEAHPVLREWTGKILKLATDLGLDLDARPS